MSVPVVALAGNPNSGKTTLFNALTGAHAKVGNYPGITVERREGRLALPGGRPATLLDVPGTYSLSARTAEEQIAIAALAGLPPQREPDAVIVVVDATQLARNLYLVLQVLALRLRVVVALNMCDVLRTNRMAVDAPALSARLGVPVVPVSALRGEGLDELRRAVAAVLHEAPPSLSRDVVPACNGTTAPALAAVAAHVPDAWSRGDALRRQALASWALLSLDEDDELWHVPDALRASVGSARRRAAEQGGDLDLALVSARYAWIDGLVPQVLSEEPGVLRRVTDAIDRVLIHPVSGFALFLLAMALVFQSLFSWSAPAIDLVDGAVAAFGGLLAGWLPAGLLSDFLTEGVVAGVGAVLVFLPQILLLFLFLSIMEDSGYMARVAFLMDRVMKGLGLTGRAFVPLLSGFACAIPAVMATRTMERRRDRLLVMLVVPLTTCSARLPVYTLVIAALFPAPDEPGGRLAGVLSVQALLMVAMYAFGTVLALLAAAVLGRTLLKGESAPLLLELPPYRLPAPRSVLRLMWERSRLFVSEAGRVILVCTIVLWALLSFPREVPAGDVPRGLSSPTVMGEAAREPADAGRPHEASAPTAGPAAPAASGHGASESSQRLLNSYGARLGRLLEPVIAPLGFDWKIGVGLIGAFAAREVFVSTMGVVYGIGEADEGSLPLRAHLQRERWPDGARVYTPLVGLSLMVFFALAAQCMSTLAVIRRETASWRWPLFVFAWMTALAYAASLAVYQGGRLLGFA